MSEPTSEPPAANRSRFPRVAGIALGVAVVAGIVWAVWLRPRAPEPPTVNWPDAPPGATEALEAARSRVKESPTSGAAWGRLGMFLRANNFNAEAERCFVQAERFDSSNPRWPYHRALDLLVSDPDAGLASLGRAVELGGPETSPRLMLGEVLMGLGRSDQAEGHFRRVLEVEPANPRAHHGLGRLAYARGHLTTSVDHLKVAIAGAPWSQASHALLAEIFFKQEDKKAAEEERRIVDQLGVGAPWPDPYAEEVMELRVGVPPRVSLASRLASQGRLGQAIALLQETIQQYPEAYDAVLSLGKVLLRQQPANYPAAETAFREAVRRKPDDPAAHFHLGIALEKQLQYRLAADSYRKAIDLKSDHAFAHYNLGQCLKQQGDKAGAVQALQNAVRCRPNFADGRRDLGELLAQGGKTAEALVQLEQAALLNPGDDKTRRLLDEVRKGRGSRE